MLHTFSVTGLGEVSPFGKKIITSYTFEERVNFLQLFCQKLHSLKNELALAVYKATGQPGKKTVFQSRTQFLVAFPKTYLATLWTGLT
jgi:hypothetical protein